MFEVQSTADLKPSAWQATELIQCFRIWHFVQGFFVTIFSSWLVPTPLSRSNFISSLHPIQCPVGKRRVANPLALLFRKEDSANSVITSIYTMHIYNVSHEFRFTIIIITIIIIIIVIMTMMVMMIIIIIAIIIIILIIIIIIIIIMNTPWLALQTIPACFHRKRSLWLWSSYCQANLVNLAIDLKGLR